MTEAPPPSTSHVPQVGDDQEDPFELVDEPPPNRDPIRPAISVSSVPSALKSWYSQSSFKQMTFAALSLLTLGLDASFMYAGIVSSEAGLGVISTLLAMNLPSPYDSKSKKKLIDASQNT
jgi:hypothetical protein